jgi:uncharacterized protein YndB with AHSA1/START domain
MNVVRVTHHFKATPERVFDAWLEPQTAAKWLFATPTGQMVRVEIDAHVGGRFSIVDRRGGEEIEHTGEYLEIDRPRRLVFTFGVPKYSPLFNRVTIDIAASDAGCELTLTQENVPDEYLGRNEKGWIGILIELEEAIADYIAKNL